MLSRINCVKTEKLNLRGGVDRPDAQRLVGAAGGELRAVPVEGHVVDQVLVLRRDHGRRVHDGRPDGDGGGRQGNIFLKDVFF